MCKIEDYNLMSLGSYRNIVENDLKIWHDHYLPIPEGTILDIGAGAGETAKFFLEHGATKVICVEMDKEAIKLLHENFDGNNRVIIVPERIDKIKIDIEGSERDMIVETHFPFKWIKKDYNQFYFNKVLVLREYWGGPFRKAVRKIIRRLL